MNEQDERENGVGTELSDDEVMTMSEGNFAWPRNLPLTRFLANMAERGLIERVPSFDHDVIAIKGHPAGT
jgi:hypothetical protein